MASSDNEAWFEKSQPEVADFEFEECPHGQLFHNNDENELEYICARCGVLFHAYQPN